MKAASPALGARLAKPAQRKIGAIARRHLELQVGQPLLSRKYALPILLRRPRQTRCQRSRHDFFKIEPRSLGDLAQQRTLARSHQFDPPHHRPRHFRLARDFQRQHPIRPRPRHEEKQPHARALEIRDLPRRQHRLRLIGVKAIGDERRLHFHAHAGQCSRGKAHLGKSRVRHHERPARGLLLPAPGSRPVAAAPPRARPSGFPAPRRRVFVGQNHETPVAAALHPQRRVEISHPAVRTSLCGACVRQSILPPRQRRRRC